MATAYVIFTIALQILVAIYILILLVGLGVDIFKKVRLRRTKTVNKPTY